jgi:hypothetical protein
MTRRWLHIFIGIVAAPAALACMTLPPELQPVLISFTDPVFIRAQDTQQPIGVVKAKISVDPAGNVTSAEIVEVNPAVLEEKPILQSIGKARFRIKQSERWPDGLKDYLHTFEFEILQPVLNRGGM